MEPEQHHRPSADDPRHRTPDSIQHSELEDLWSKYKVFIVGIPLVIVLFVAGWMWWEIKRDEQRTAARQALSQAETQTQLREVAEEFSGTVIGGEALLLLSRKQHEEGDLTAASETLMTFTEEYPRHPLVPGAWFALAGISGQLGDEVRALDLYRRIRSDYAESYVAGPATESAARLLAQQGQIEEAVALMEELLQEMETAAERDNVEFQIAMLKRVKEPLSEIPDPEPELETNPRQPLQPAIPGAEGLQNMPQLGNPALELNPNREDAGQTLQINPSTGLQEITDRLELQPAGVDTPDREQEPATAGEPESAPDAEASPETDDTGDGANATEDTQPADQPDEPAQE